MLRAKLNTTKLIAVAEFARFCRRNPGLVEDKLLPQTLGIAIRKLHDFGRCGLGSGKYLGHPCWTRNARRLLNRSRTNIDQIKEFLSHEHVIPVHVVVKELLSLPRSSTVTDFERLVRRLSLVAIITREEEVVLRKVRLANAPDPGWIYTDPWWRYRKAKLLSQVIDDTGKRIDA